MVRRELMVVRTKCLAPNRTHSLSLGEANVVIGGVLEEVLVVDVVLRS